MLCLLILLLLPQERLASSIAESRQERSQLADKVQQLETHCSGLEFQLREAQQQQQHDHCYQDALANCPNKLHRCAL